jgi:hypothetical protein
MKPLFYLIYLIKYFSSDDLFGDYTYTPTEDGEDTYEDSDDEIEVDSDLPTPKSRPKRGIVAPVSEKDNRYAINAFDQGFDLYLLIYFTLTKTFFPLSLLSTYNFFVRIF